MTPVSYTHLVSINDIDKVEIQKDGASYGMKGANGVIIITTIKKSHITTKHACTMKHNRIRYYLSLWAVLSLIHI